MKTKASICFAILLLCALCACAAPKTEGISPAKYVYEDAEGVVKPYVLLKGNNEYLFEYSMLSSYLNIGTYKVENDTLILTTDDGEYTYTFHIKNGNLFFDLEASSKITVYKGESPIVDGAEFVLENGK